MIVPFIRHSNTQRVHVESICGDGARGLCLLYVTMEEYEASYDE